jgi:hypothetical protein
MYSARCEYWYAFKIFAVSEEKIIQEAEEIGNHITLESCTRCFVFYTFVYMNKLT